MPSVVAGVSGELDELLDWMVDTGRAEDRSDAAQQLMRYAAYNKYDRNV